MPRAMVSDEQVPFSGAPLRYFIREALRRLWVSRRNSFVAVALIAISLLILGAFLLLSENLRGAVDAWQGKSRLTVYLEAGSGPDVVRAIDAQLAARPTLERRRYVPPEEAMRKFKGFFSDLAGVVDDLGENPFPPSFEVEVAPEVTRSRAFHDQISAIRGLRGVDDVEYDWEWTAKMRNLIRLIDLTGLFVGGILALAAAFTIANVTRLTMVLYKEEVDIMRLVGATEGIIRGPFVVEGILQGLLGGILAAAMLYGAFEGAKQLVTPANALLLQFLFRTFLPWQKVAALIGGGALAGLIGSWLSLRQQPAESAGG